MRFFPYVKIINMSFESFNQRGQNEMNEAMAALAAIEAQVHVMGANDSETSESGDLAQVRAKLTNGELTPEEAIARAEGIRDSKQAYH